MFNGGVKKVSRSFHVDIKQFSLTRVLGAEKTVSSRKLDVTDLMSVLIEEGFNDFEEPRTYIRMSGYDLEGLREQVVSNLLGVPCDAFVSIKAVGKHKNHLTVSFDY